MDAGRLKSGIGYMIADSGFQLYGPIADLTNFFKVALHEKREAT